MKLRVYRFFRKNSVFEVIKPFFWILRFYGLAAFTFEKTTYKSSCWATIPCLFSLIVSNYRWFIAQHYNSNFSKVLEIGRQMLWLFPQFLIIVLVISNFVQKKRHFNIYKKIHEFDRKVKIFWTNCDHFKILFVLD